MAQLLCNSIYYDKFKLKDFDNLLNEFVINDELAKFYLIVPTGKLVRKLQQDIVNLYYHIHHKPLELPKIFTIETFVKQCHYNIFQNKYRLVSDAYRLALFEEAAEIADLQFYRGKDNQLSNPILKRLSELIYGLKEDGINPESLLEDIENSKINQDNTKDLLRLQDVANIYISYQNILADGLLDFPEMLNITTGFIKNKISQDENMTNNVICDLSSIVSCNNTVIMYGFSEFKVPEADFISLFSKSNIPFSLFLDYSTNNGPIFGNLEYHISKLTDSGFRLFGLNNEEPKNLFDSTEDISRCEYVRKNLFVTQKPLKQSDLSSFIKIFEVNNRAEEVKYIAELVKYLVLVKGISHNSICIALRQIENYSAMFREVFPQYGIPVNISDRFNLADSPVVVSIFSILNIINQGYRRDDIHRAMKSYYLKLTDENNNSIELDTNNFYDIALKYRVSGGRGKISWEKFFNKYIDSTNDLLLFLKDNIFEESEYRQTMLKLENLNKAYSDFELFCRFLPDKKGNISPFDFAEIIKKGIIENFHIKEQILLLYSSSKKESQNEYINKMILYEKSEKDARALTSFIELVDEMVYILNDRYFGRKFSLLQLTERLKTAVSAQKYQIKEKQNYGVNVTTIEQTRSIPYQVMILAGAIDGEFPMAYKAETFLGKELPNTKERHFRAECMQFYQFLTNAPSMLDSGEKLIYIFYPKFNKTEELVRSPFIDALSKILNTEDKNYYYDISECRRKINSLSTNADELNIPEEIYYFDAIASKSDLYEFIGNKFYYNNQNIILNDISYMSISNIRFIDYFINLSKTRQDDSINDSSLNIPKELYKQITNFDSKSYSITELEMYSRCAYKYFISYMLNTKEERDYEETVSNIEIGDLLHSILNRFYKILQKQQNDILQGNTVFNSQDYPSLNSVPVKLDQLKHKYYEELIFKLADEEIKKIEFDSPYFDLVKKEIFGYATYPGILRLWIENEINQLNNNEFYPMLFELAFGLKEKIKGHIPAIEISNGLKINGKIDRVDISFKNENNPEIIIADYKLRNSSVIPKKNDILEGNSFQMPLYLAAIKKIFQEYLSVNPSLSGAVYKFLRPEYQIEKSNPVLETYILNTKAEKKPDTNIEEYINISIDNATRISNLISEGIFPVNPNKDIICSYCSFQSLCRIKESGS